ncbi:MAG TPA: hypothetical protein DIU00_23995 [Phycisphaerales bacterium]|nr:hypothetical protein [Phycisphaerales bacterium]
MDDKNLQYWGVREGCIMIKEIFRSLKKRQSGSACQPGPATCGVAVCPRYQHVPHRHLRRRGIALIWTALVILVMVLFVGLSLDAGKLVLNAQQLQNAADAAAMAGALYVKTELPDFVRMKAAEAGFANAAEKLHVTLQQIEQPANFPIADDGSYDFSGHDIIIGRWIRYYQTFLPTLDNANAVMVITRRHEDLAEMDAPPLRLIWGPIVGVDTANAAKETIAYCSSSNGAGLIVLSNEPEQTLNIAGNSVIDIDNGGIHVNSPSAVEQSNHTAAWIQNATAVIDATFLNVVGGVNPEPDSDMWDAIFANAEEGGYTVLDHMDGVQSIDDPLAAGMLSGGGTPYVIAYDEDGIAETGPGARLDLEALLDYYGGPLETFDKEEDPNWDTITSNMTLGPGYYPNGMLISAGVDVVLQPNPALGFLGNIFIFGGGPGPNNSTVGLSVSNGSLTGHGVTIYVTETLDPTGQPIGEIGQIKITGGTVDIDSPGDWQNQENGSFNPALVEGINGIAVWQDPAMPFGNNDDVQLNGTGDFHLSGAIYLPSPIHADLAGNLGDTGNQILCGSADIAGGANIHVNYDGRNEGNSPTMSCIVH